jgi:hypothetical protein
MAFRVLQIIACSFCSIWCGSLTFAEQAKPIRKLSFDPAAKAVDLLSEDAKAKLAVRVIPQNEFRSRIRIENLTDEPLTVRVPPAVAAVHALPSAEAAPQPRVRVPGAAEPAQEESQGAGQAVVGTFGPLDDPANAFPHQSEAGSEFTIPARGSVLILLHSACAEHGKRPPISRMTYQLKPLDNQVENEVLRKVVQSYDPEKTDRQAFQAAVWHLANGLSWEMLAEKTVKRGGQIVAYFTRQQLIEAQQLIEKSNGDSR